MRICRISILLTLLCTLSFAAGPADRQPTDPKSITSQSNPSAKPVPIDDLFFSRRVELALVVVRTARPSSSPPT